MLKYWTGVSLFYKQFKSNLPAKDWMEYIEAQIEVCHLNQLFRD